MIAAFLGVLVYGARDRGTRCFANIAEGRHLDGRITKLADAAIASRWLLVKFGTDADHVDLCGATDVPIGVCTDEPEAAEDATAVDLLGAAPGTTLMVASEAITAGELVFTAASGKVQDLPAGAGTYYQVGRALNAAGADGDLVEVAPCFPLATVVS